MQSTIGLNFIMKNESRVLMRMLNSVNPMIDGCVCVDTGSTDDSKKIVKEFFEKAGKPCEIYDYTLPFNFGDARQFALVKAGQKYTFNFWIDCDEQLILSEPFDKQKISDSLIQADHASIQVDLDNKRYARIQFWRTSKPYYWVYPYHELLGCNEKTIGITIDPNLASVLVNSDGSSYDNKKVKHHKAIQMLLDWIKKNGEDPRCVYYLAQEYANGNMLEKSLEWYKKRVRMENGDAEERYWSQYMIACLSAGLKRPRFEVIDQFLLCSEFDSLRAEHFVKIITILHEMGRYEGAYLYSSFAMERFHGKCPFPERGLNIDTEVYSHKILNLHKINCEKTGRPLTI